jgi:hypothetical protein
MLSKQRKETTMKFTIKTTIFVLVTGLVALTFSASASSARKGELHIVKECSQNTGLPGAFCTITASNVAAIPVGAKVFYFQSAIPSTGLKDSNIVLDAGDANRAVGRCTLDLATGLALCTFSDGTGQLEGFNARIDGSGTSLNYHWDGTYSFTADKQHGNE